MPLTDPQSLHPLPGTTVTPITQRRVIITPDPHRRGYNTSEFWVSVFALLLSWLDAHFASA